MIVSRIYRLWYSSKCIKTSWKVLYKSVHHCIVVEEDHTVTWNQLITKTTLKWIAGKGHRKLVIMEWLFWRVWNKKYANIFCSHLFFSWCLHLFIQEYTHKHIHKHNHIHNHMCIHTHKIFQRQNHERKYVHTSRKAWVIQSYLSFSSDIQCYLLAL